ncbi:MAG: RHS repeat-associated core domain-containing protein [Bacteroidales bacterium]|nr:RHS repeat-associated core domain-containing protein [Bacteroidales bacterium]
MGTQAMNTYGFEYDKLGRLKNTLHYSAAATTPTAACTERGITYDLNGNITTLKRYAASEATPEDDYQYIYTGNKLTQIAGTDNNATISNATYTYDSNGNMRSDGLKNLQISYNFLNLPSVVNQDDTPVAEYSWFADGCKYRVLTQQNNGYIYTGSLIYASNNGNLQIESTNFAGGRINLAQTGSMASGTNNTGSTLTQDIHYFHTDHLGSVRAITDNSGSVIEQNAYYPFGSRHTFGNTYAQTTNRFKFNGKEEQTTGNLNYLDYGARMYDANIGRWFVQDPLAEQMYMVTPYRFSLNNPVNFIDPDGLFETRKEARQYKREYDTGGYVDKNDDGTYSINNKKAGYSYSKQADADPNTIGLDENGVVKSIIVTPYTHNENPIIQSIYDGQQDFIENPITKFIASTIFCVTAEGVIISSLQSTSLLSNATTFDHLLLRLPLEKHRKSILYFKKGNYRTACRDFKKLNVKEINQYKTKNGIVKAGRDRNGNEIIVRQCSSHNGYPTLECQIKRNNTTIKYEKIRYR